MTEETRKLFVAPWEATQIKGIEWGVRIKDGGLLLCDFCEEENAKRFASLPELYDALLQATEDACRTCNHEKAEGILDRPCNDLHANECYVAEWRKLLKKVRDGA